MLDALEPILRDRQAHTEIVGEAPDVLGNLDRLKQAVTNLVENASRFIEPGGHITIELFGFARKLHPSPVKGTTAAGFGDVDPHLPVSIAFTADRDAFAQSRGTGRNRPWDWPS